MMFCLEEKGLVFLSDSRILQDEEEDAIFIVAQLCSDTFSSVSIGDFNNGTSYSLYAR